MPFVAREWKRILVEEDVGVMEVHSTPQGNRLMAGLNIAMCDEDVDATRRGLKCINCQENLDREGAEGPYGVCSGTAWPKSCFLCGYPVGDRQAEQFARVYKGYDPTARTGADLEAAADRMADRAERRAFARRAKESGISLASRSVGEALKRMKGGR
jgi:hypothetical protein